MASLRRTRVRSKQMHKHGYDAAIEKTSYSPSILSVNLTDAKLLAGNNTLILTTEADNTTNDTDQFMRKNSRELEEDMMNVSVHHAKADGDFLIEACAGSPQLDCMRCRSCSDQNGHEHQGEDGHTNGEHEDDKNEHVEHPQHKLQRKSSKQKEGHFTKEQERQDHVNAEAVTASTVIANGKTNSEIVVVAEDIDIEFETTTESGSEQTQNSSEDGCDVSETTHKSSPRVKVEVTLEGAIIRLEKEKLPKKLRKQYTWEDIEKHATEESCWIVVNRKVYDVTRFIHIHPAGSRSILNAAGTDCTRHYYFHSKKAQKLFSCFCIGYVERSNSRKESCSLQ